VRLLGGETETAFTERSAVVQIAGKRIVLFSRHLILALADAVGFFIY
jgi:hypothetical protein